MLEFLLFFLGYGYSIPSFTEGYNLALLLLSFILPLVIWYSLKSIFIESLKTPFLEKSLMKFQNNVSVFKYLLSEQHAMLRLPLNMSIIELGKSDSTNIITIVTSPYCGACFNIHTIADDIINENMDNVKCQFIFWATNRPNDKRGDFVRHLYSLDNHLRVNALEAWFSQQYNFEEWQRAYPIQKISEKVFEIVEQHEKWCIESNTRFTPTVFINGHLLPDLYRFQDIKRIAPYIFAK